MLTPMRTVLAGQILVFTFAAVAHTGMFGGRSDPAAAFAEAIIAMVLAASLAFGLRAPRAAPKAALAGQGFALLGTLVGFTLVVFVGPTHAFDVMMHSTMMGLLAVGLLVTWRGEGSVLAR